MDTLQPFAVAMLASRLFVAAVFAMSVSYASVRLEVWGLTAILFLASAAWAVTSWGQSLKMRRITQLTDQEGAGAAAPIESEFCNTGSQTLARRLSERHGASGLPTREPLLAKMADDKRGFLGAFAIADFDRLTGLDPDAADHLLMEVGRRLDRMVQPGRLIAHVDRAHFAIWFGPSSDLATARAELDALAYALADIVTTQRCDVTPDVLVRSAELAEGREPATLVSQTLASFSLAGPKQRRLDLTPAVLAEQGEYYRLEQDLRGAIGRGEFDLDFQPLVDANAGMVIGAEALIRWSHPLHGAVAPAQFVPIVERCGLAEEVGLWVINSAVRAAWQFGQTMGRPLNVAVNVSALQLHSLDLAAILARILKNHSLTPELLEIELTETIASAGDEGIAARLAAIRALGVRVAIDDFGTGYSSFSSLRQLAFDKIKIDREFVTEVHERPECQAICDAILALGRGLGIEVLAEGVEHAAEFRWLAERGCRHFQGFHFSPPLSARDFLSFARDNKLFSSDLSSSVAPPPPRKATEYVSNLS